MTKYIELIDKYEIRQSDSDEYNPPSYIWRHNTGELIRCKDCKFAHITDGVYGNNPEVKYCDIWFPNVSEYMPINYYCASAERKEE